ncbi:MAG: hypothetical protein D6B28_02770, partial [Gammaproteobacteria bacterium]
KTTLLLQFLKFTTYLWVKWFNSLSKRIEDGPRYCGPSLLTLLQHDAEKGKNQRLFCKASSQQVHGFFAKRLSLQS